MFCQHCGKELPEGAGFCPACGKPQNSVTATSTDVPNGSVIPCPYCGSTDIVKRKTPSALYIMAIASFVVGVIFFIIRFQPGSTGWWTLLALGFMGFGGFNLLLALAAAKDWDNSKLNLQCNTCNKEFSIDFPNGGKIFTNVKSD